MEQDEIEKKIQVCRSAMQQRLRQLGLQDPIYSKLEGRLELLAELQEGSKPVMQQRTAEVNIDKRKTRTRR